MRICGFVFGITNVKITKRERGEGRGEGRGERGEGTGEEEREEGLPLFAVRVVSSNEVREGNN